MTPPARPPSEPAPPPRPAPAAAPPTVSARNPAPHINNRRLAIALASASMNSSRRFGTSVVPALNLRVPLFVDRHVVAMVRKYAAVDREKGARTFESFALIRSSSKSAARMPRSFYSSCLSSFWILFRSDGSGVRARGCPRAHPPIRNKTINK